MQRQQASLKRYDPERASAEVSSAVATASGTGTGRRKKRRGADSGAVAGGAAAGAGAEEVEEGEVAEPVFKVRDRFIKKAGSYAGVVTAVIDEGGRYLYRVVFDTEQARPRKGATQRAAECFEDHVTKDLAKDPAQDAETLGRVATRGKKMCALSLMNGGGFRG